MKNFDTTMTAGFEKMGSRREIKKDKSTDRKLGSSREQQRSTDYEEYFNSRYGNKLDK